VDSAQPIIIKKIIKGGHGHHGGAWKVAFADFVTAMMAFFLLMWLMGSTTPEQRAAISDYFENPSAVRGPGGASNSMIQLGKTDNNMKQADSEQQERREEKVVEKLVERDQQMDKRRLEVLKMDLEAAIQASQALKPFKDQLLLDITPEGLRIQIVDKENRTMFDMGSSHLKDYTEVILKEIAKIINKVPNKISLTGHTDATPYSSMMGFTNWELSTERANASRRALVRGGLAKQKIAKVVGLADTVLFDKENPRNPVNRRISIIVMNKEAEMAMQGNNVNWDESRSEKEILQSVNPNPDLQNPGGQSQGGQNQGGQNQSGQNQSGQNQSQKPQGTAPILLPEKPALPAPRMLGQ